MIWLIHALLSLSVAAHAVTCGERFAALFNHLAAKGAFTSDDVEAYLAGDEPNPVRAGSRLPPIAEHSFARAFDNILAEGRLKKPALDALVRGVAAQKKEAGERRAAARDRTDWLFLPHPKESNLSGKPFWELKETRTAVAEDGTGVLMVKTKDDRSSPLLWTVRMPDGKLLRLPKDTAPTDVARDGSRLIVATLVSDHKGPRRLKIYDASTGKVVNDHALLVKHQESTKGMPPRALFFRNEKNELCVFSAWARSESEDYGPGEIFNLRTRKGSKLPALPTGWFVDYVVSPDKKSVYSYSLGVEKDWVAVVTDAVSGRELQKQTFTPQHRVDYDFALYAHVSRKGEHYLVVRNYQQFLIFDFARGKKAERTILDYLESVPKQPLDEDPQGNVRFVYRDKHDLASLDAGTGKVKKAKIGLTRLEDSPLPPLLTRSSRDGGALRAYVPVLQDHQKSVIFLDPSGVALTERVSVTGEDLLGVVSGTDGEAGVLLRTEDPVTDTYRLSLTQIRGPKPQR